MSIDVSCVPPSNYSFGLRLSTKSDSHISLAFNSFILLKELLDFRSLQSTVFLASTPEFSLNLDDYFPASSMRENHDQLRKLKTSLPSTSNTESITVNVEGKYSFSLESEDTKKS